MPTVLAARPASPPPAGPPSRRGRAVGVTLVAAGLVLAVALWGRGLLPDWDLPLEQQTVDRSGPALMLALDDLAEHHAAQGTFQSVVDLERDIRWVPSLVSGERTTYLATGTVDGVVDFSGLGAGAVRTNDDDTAVTITLPRPRLGEPHLDLEQSRVVSRDRGIGDRLAGVFSDDPTSEREVALLAERKLTAAAADSDLLERAEDNTRTLLTELARSFGYQDVTVRFDAADGL